MVGFRGQVMYGRRGDRHSSADTQEQPAMVTRRCHAGVVDVARMLQSLCLGAGPRCAPAATRMAEQVEPNGQRIVRGLGCAVFPGAFGATWLTGGACV